MGWLLNLFKKKKIIQAKIIAHTEGFDEDLKLNNIIVGDMMDGFDGAVAASGYNDLNSSETTFLITFDDGSTQTVTVKNNSLKYDYYMQYVK